VNVHLLNRSVAVEVDHDAITPVSTFVPQPVRLFA
jgi:hypothetical protein